MTDNKKSRDLFPDVISIGNIDTYVRNGGSDMIFKDPRTSSEVTLTALRTKSITVQSNNITVGHPTVLNFSTNIFGISITGNVASLSLQVGGINHNSLASLQGGPSSYFHLTQAQHDGLVLGNSTALHVHPIATGSTNGYLSAADKTKLDGLSATSFTGDLAVTTNGFLSNSTSSTPVISKDDDGLAIQNTAGTQGNLTRVIFGTTTNATPTELTVDNGGTKFFTLASGTTHTYVVYITAKGTSGTNVNSSGSWQLQACLSNISGTTQIIGNGAYLKTIVGKDISGWDVNLTADNANSRLAITVTGDSATGITWSGWVAETII